jgi:hypothetical protein
MEHEWKDVPETNGVYQVSSLGGVRRLTVNGWRDLKAKKGDGYHVVVIGRKPYQVHRLIAKAFLPPSDKPVVNHLNGIKSDNRVSNLEWATHQENLVHARQTGLNKGKGKPRDDLASLAREDTSRQARYNAKRRLEGATIIAIQFRADEPEAQVWKELVQWFGSPKKAMSELIKQAIK